MLDRLANITGSADHFDAIARAGMLGTPLLLLIVVAVKFLAA